MSDIMLHGVLNMPPELWIGTPIDVMQRHSRYIQASEYIKELTEQRDKLAEELKEAQDTIGLMLKDSSCCTIPRYTKENLIIQTGEEL
jgi:hypothetical protein